MRLWRAPRPLSVIAILVALGSLSGGCSYRLGGTGKDDKADTVTRTSSIAPPKAATRASATTLPPDGDLAFAKAAAADVLNRGGGDMSLPWENPQTGARGTVTPIAAAHSEAGATCRDFLASYVREGAESWLQGEACRADEGKWEVKSIRPWRRT
jgi:17 kDa outer membrane surface antigen